MYYKIFGLYQGRASEQFLLIGSEIPGQKILVDRIGPQLEKYDQIGSSILTLLIRSVIGPDKKTDLIGLIDQLNFF